MTVFPQNPSPCFSPLPLPHLFHFTLMPTLKIFISTLAIFLCNKIIVGGRGSKNFVKQLSLAPNIYACVTGQLLLSIFYNYHYSDWDEQWRRKDAYWGCPQFLLISEVPVTANGPIHI